MAERLWTSRAGGVADVDGILGLRRVCFGEVDLERLRPETWRWQFADNPAGAGYVRLADHGGRIVGQYAAIPTRFLVDGAERTFAMSCDTMTHPDYQKQGIFVTLARDLYDDLAERHGVTTAWGFPNDASHPGFVGKLGWVDVHVFPLRVKPIRSGPVLRRWVRPGAVADAFGAVADRAYRLVTPRVRELRRCRFEPLSTFDARFDALWARHAGLAPVIQIRDSAFLNWRYCAVPGFDYRCWGVHVGERLEGYLVTRVVELFGVPVGAVVDLFPCPLLDADATREVLAFAQLRAAEQGAAFLTALATPAHAPHLTRFGFLTVPDRFNPRRWYLGVRCAAADAPTLRDVGNWHVTYGDADIL
jgi:GNAT superfamily N-acetyltransferase